MLKEPRQNGSYTFYGWTDLSEEGRKRLVEELVSEGVARAEAEEATKTVYEILLNTERKQNQLQTRGWAVASAPIFGGAEEVTVFGVKKGKLIHKLLSKPETEPFALEHLKRWSYLVRNKDKLLKFLNKATKAHQLSATFALAEKELSLYPIYKLVENHPELTEAVHSFEAGGEIALSSA